MKLRSLPQFIFITLILTLAPQCFSQQETFEKVKSGIRSFSNSFSVIEHPGIGYIIAKEGCISGIPPYHYSISSKIFNIDYSGRLLWENNVQGSNILIFKNNNEITAVTTDYPLLRISKFNFNGEEIFSHIDEDSLIEHYAAGGRSHFYVLGIVDSQQIIITKFDNNFNILWKKPYNIPSAVNSNPKVFLESSSGLLYFGYIGGLLKLDSDGNLIVKKLTKVRSLCELPNGKIFYTDYSKKIWEISPDTIQLHKIMLSSIINLSYTYDNGIIVNCIDSTFRLDSTGDIVWKKQLRVRPEISLQTLDNGFLFGGIFNKGHYSPYLWLLKSGADGFYNSMDIYFPENTVVSYSFKEITAEYITNFQTINAYASYDNRSSWEKIKSNFPGDSGSFTWIPSVPASQNCYLKITNADDESIFDETETSFSIVLYKDYDYIAVNEIKMWVGNNGIGSYRPSLGSGFFWPGGENASISAVFNDGLVWGGKINSDVRFNGSARHTGILPGRILENNTPAHPLDTKSRIFKIKKNWESLSEGRIKELLRADFRDWPGEYGAPYDDLDKNGIFTSGIDNPAFLGDEVLFYAANDLDTLTSKYTYGSLPIGLEFQTTIWGYDSTNFLKDVVFKRYIVINKSSNTIDSMYLGYYSDDDMGNAADDFTGCDTNLNIGFTYNGDNNDQSYYGTPPPAVAHMFVQGPFVPSSPLDSAKVKNKWRKGYKNLNLYAFFPFNEDVFPFWDPDLYTGASQFYNNLQGLSRDGLSIIDPKTNKVTKFPLSGDPEKGEGWYEGPGWYGGPIPYERRNVISTGPFTFAPGDTQEVVIAIFMAQGTNNLNSVTELKRTAAKLQEFWKNLEMHYSEGQIIPEGYILYQNYPNPFNPATTIRYELPEWSNVELKVYDVLGREVITLINKEQPAGKYRVEMNSGTIGNGLASGVYIYRLKTNNYVSSKKMLLIK